jgi:uncharacterized protein with PIN domain
MREVKKDFAEESVLCPHCGSDLTIVGEVLDQQPMTSRLGRVRRIWRCGRCKKRSEEGL